jgi:RHS repeat-associated protein
MTTMPTSTISLRRPRGARTETRCRRHRPPTRCPGTSHPRHVALARYYDPTIGRFTATDPLADLSSPGTLDAYGYASGSPVTLSDPTGLLNELGGGAYGHTYNMCRGYSLSACDRMSLFRPAKPSKPWSGPFGSPLRGAKNAIVGTARTAGGLVGDVGGCANNGHCEFQTTRAIQHGIADSITHPSHVYRPCREDPGACLGEVAMGWFMGRAAGRALGRPGSLVDDAIPAWEGLLDDAAAKLPDSWGPGIANRKGVGNRWTDPSDVGNGVRIDQGTPGASFPSQRVDHVVVRSEGRILGPDGKPIVGSLAENPQAHIPLTDWLDWDQWNQPG